MDLPDITLTWKEAQELRDMVEHIVYLHETDADDHRHAMTLRDLLNAKIRGEIVAQRGQK